MNTDFDSAASRWFALRVKSRCEKLVFQMVQNKGFEGFLPLSRVRRRWSDRMKETELPLFPGYVFLRLDPRYRLPLLTIPGTLHFVGLGKTPTPLEDEEIEAIQKALRSGLSAEAWPYLAVGQRIRLDDGPLAGLEGILVGTSKHQRILVSLTLLQRSVAVSIERHWVTPIHIPAARYHGVPASGNREPEKVVCVEQQRLV